MKFIEVILAIAAAHGLMNSNRHCHGQRFHSARTSDDMIKILFLFASFPLPDTDFEAQWDIDAGISKGTHPTSATTSNRTRSECDRRSGGDALWYRATCRGGCAVAGPVQSDYCYT